MTSGKAGLFTGQVSSGQRERRFAVREMWEEEPQSLSRMNQARYDAGRMPDRLAISQSTRLLVLTGAGVSAESGLSTFRDANGLPGEPPGRGRGDARGLRARREGNWRFYSARRAGAKACAPNAGHAALAELERRLGDQFLLVTQNVDDLHRRAGNTRLIELHGNVFFTKCTRCGREPFPDEAEYEDDPLPTCGQCRQRGLPRAGAAAAPHRRAPVCVVVQQVRVPAMRGRAAGVPAIVNADLKAASEGVALGRYANLAY